MRTSQNECAYFLLILLILLIRIVKKTVMSGTSGEHIGNSKNEFLEYYI